MTSELNSNFFFLSETMNFAPTNEKKGFIQQINSRFYKKWVFIYIVNSMNFAPQMKKKDSSRKLAIDFYTKNKFFRNTLQCPRLLIFDKILIVREKKNIQTTVFILRIHLRKI